MSHFTFRFVSLPGKLASSLIQLHALFRFRARLRCQNDVEVGGAVAEDLGQLGCRINKELVLAGCAELVLALLPFELNVDVQFAEFIARLNGNRKLTVVVGEPNTASVVFDVVVNRMDSAERTFLTMISAIEPPMHDTRPSCAR
jgi:hypothetical protein